MMSKPEPSYSGLANAIVEKLLESDDFGIVADDEIWELRESVRRNPELREIYSLTSKATPDKMRQIRDFVRFVTKGDDDDDTNTP